MKLADGVIWLTTVEGEGVAPFRRSAHTRLLPETVAFNYIAVSPVAAMS